MQIKTKDIWANRFGSRLKSNMFQKWDGAKLRTKLSDFERFVELSGYDLKRDNSLDIVQLGLQEPHESEVYRTAQRCVGSRRHNTYLRFQSVLFSFNFLNEIKLDI